MEVNPEVIYKAMLLNARIEEIPAHLDWYLQRAEGIKRRSSVKVLRQTTAVLLSGFLFRPVMFFIIPGCAMLLFAIYVNVWMLIHFFEEYQNLPQYTWFFSRASVAIGAAYSQFPHTFIVGGLALMLAIQLISLGILALQSKSYFEEMFHLSSSIYGMARDRGDENGSRKRVANPCKRIVVTGAAGFLGSHLLDKLLALGHGSSVSITSRWENRRTSPGIWTTRRFGSSARMSPRRPPLPSWEGCGLRSSLGRVQDSALRESH
jgi:hypothetical protein